MSMSNPEARLIGALNTTQAHSIVVERNSDGSYMLLDGALKRIIPASTQPAAIDAVVALVNQRARASDIPNKPVNLHLRGFQPREGYAFSRSTELRLNNTETRPAVTTTVHDSDLSLEDLTTILKTEYDFQQVSIRKISETFVTTRGEEAVNIELEARPRERSGRTLLLRITAVLRTGVRMTADMLSSIKEVVVNVFRSGQFRGTAALGIADKVVKRLQQTHPGLSYVEIKLQFEEEGRGVYIVRNDEDRRGAGTAGEPA
jgi:hypothetical protein